MIPLNMIEAEYLLHTLATTTPGAKAHDLELRREIDFGSGTRWYYLIDFSYTQGGSDGYARTEIRYSYPPYTDAPALAGALWRACAAALDEALILHAHTTRYTLDYRAGVSSVPMCLHCKGSGIIARTVTHTTGKGKNRETTTEVRDEKCSPCNGTGKRGHMPFFGPDFDAFCAQRPERPERNPNNPGT